MVFTIARAVVSVIIDMECGIAYRYCYGSLLSSIVMKLVRVRLF